jgi:hypothetical protein
MRFARSCSLSVASLRDELRDGRPTGVATVRANVYAR